MKFIASDNENNKFNTVISSRRFSADKPVTVPWWRQFIGIMDFLWSGIVYQDYLISSLVDRRKIMITGKDFVTDYIPATSTASFTLQADADLILDDTDNFWFDGSGVQKSVSVGDMVVSDYGRTIIKYSAIAPYDVSAIGVIKSGVILSASKIDKLHEMFELWIFWNGYLNQYGYLKTNRTFV